MLRLQRSWLKLRELLSGWKTVLFGLALAMSGAVLEILVFTQTIDLSLLFTPRSAVIANIVIGLLIIVLRYFTTGPVGVTSPVIETEVADAAVVDADTRMTDAVVGQVMADVEVKAATEAVVVADKAKTLDSM